MGKATGPVQQAIILLWFILSEGLFQVPRQLFVPVLESPASELRDQADYRSHSHAAGQQGVALLAGLGGGLGLQHNRTPLHFFPDIHQRSLFVISWCSFPGQEGAFPGPHGQDGAEESR